MGTKASTLLMFLDVTSSCLFHCSGVSSLHLKCLHLNLLSSTIHYFCVKCNVVFRR
jgi:hypothetical protein